MPRKSTQPHHIQRVHRTVQHAVVPHKGNGFHPHLVRWQGIVAVLLIVAGLLAIPIPQGKTAVLGDVTDVTTQYLLDDTNLERTKADLAPLGIDKRLSAAATAKRATCSISSIGRMSALTALRRGSGLKTLGMTTTSLVKTLPKDSVLRVRLSRPGCIRPSTETT